MGVLARVAESCRLRGGVEGEVGVAVSVCASWRAVGLVARALAGRRMANSDSRRRIRSTAASECPPRSRKPMWMGAAGRPIELAIRRAMAWAMVWAAA